MPTKPIARTVEDICRDARQLAARGRKSDALALIRDVVVYTITRQSSHARVFTSKSLDLICQEVGRIEDRSIGASESFDGERTVFLATFLASTGGHTRVLKELLEADEAKRFTLILTNVSSSATIESVKALFPGLEINIRIAPEVDLYSRVLWVQDILRMLRPTRVYILQHHFDSVAVAAAQPNLMQTLIYFHNCDHSLALGAHIPHAIHVDFNGKGFYNCRDCEGIENNVCWPLGVVTPGARVEPSTGAAYTTCTSGGFEKFATPHLVESIPYTTNYADVISDIILATGGRHIHIGHLPDQLAESIDASLRAHSVPADRFLNLPFVESLPATFVSHGVDVYIGSFPLGGGRAMVEAMSAALPLIVYSNYRSVFFTDENEVYPGAIKWRNKDELVSALVSLKSPTERRRHGYESGRFFLANFRREELKLAMDRTFAGAPPPAPQRPVYYPNPLQTFLDEQTSLYESRSQRIGVDALEYRDKQIRELSDAFAFAQKLAYERLDTIVALDAQSQKLDQALRVAEELAFSRLEEIERLRARKRSRWW